MAGNTRHQLSAVDYVILVGSLLGAFGIGIWSVVKSKFRGKEMTRSTSAAAEDLVRTKELSMAPVILSLVASFLSAILIVGYPAQVYAYGADWTWSLVGKILAILGAYSIFVPVMYPLNLDSTFQYFEIRYESWTVKTVAACMFLLYMSLYMGIALYAPVVALASMTNVPEWAAILLAGAVCTTYSSIGGLRGVVLTDVFQVAIMFGSMLATLVYGVVQVGGFKKVFETCSNYGRAEFFHFSVDPYIRHTFWSCVSNIALMWLYVFGGTQASFQRYSSMKTLARAKLVLLMSIPGIMILVGLSFLIGFMLFAFYATCDPLLTGEIEKADQILPHFVMTEMGHIYGLPGLFIASLFGGGLSTMSSGLNALACVAWEDGIRMTPWAKSLSSDQKLNVVRFLGFMFGVIAIGLAFLSSTLGTITQVAVTLTTTFASPLLAMFVVSLFLPFVNKIGVIGGGVAAFAVASWIGFGAYLENIPPHPRLPSTTDGCAADFHQGNGTYQRLSSLATDSPFNYSAAISDPWATDEFGESEMAQPSGKNIYHVSYLLYIHFGAGTGIVTSIVLSLLSGGLNSTYKNAAVFHPLVRRFVKIRNININEDG